MASQAKAIRIALADKSPIIQAALRQIFSEDDRFELVNVASDCEEFLSLADRKQFDVGVIGWIIGPCDGRFILDHLSLKDHAPPVVIYTGHPGESVPALVMAHGGAAFVSKSEQPAVLLNTIEEVANGRMVFPFIDVRTLYDNPMATLTRRELEVLSKLASGRTNKQIARDMKVSLNTIKFHVKNLFQKLGVNSRSQAIGIYLKT